LRKAFAIGNNDVIPTGSRTRVAKQKEALRLIRFPLFIHVFLDCD